MSADLNLLNIRKALDSSAIVAITDPAGVIKYVNTKFVEISQYSESELVGQNHRIINSGVHSRDFFKDLWKKINSGKMWEGEVCNRAKDGSLYWVHTTILPFFKEDGSIDEFVSIRWDITDRKEAEQKLLAAKENLQSLIDASFEGLLVYDLSGEIRWCNQSAQNIFLETEAILLTKSIESLLGSKYVPFSENTQSLETTINSEKKVLEVSTKPYHFREHRAYLLTIRDITEKSRLEIQVLQQERLASVGVLASGLAHEIGTPLGVVRGRAELISMLPDLPESVTSGAKIIIQQIDRVSHLIRNLLKLARGEAEETPKAVHVLSLLADIEDFLRVELKKNSIALKIEVPDSFEVLGVYNSMFQVVLNLLVNAIHAIQDKNKNDLGQSGTIRIWSEANENHKILHIEDDGIGMTGEVMKNLFTPFFSTKEVGRGTGLGLPTSFKILQSWGGYISASSNYGKGSTLSIYIPARRL